MVTQTTASTGNKLNATQHLSSAWQGLGLAHSHLTTDLSSRQEYLEIRKLTIASFEQAAEALRQAIHGWNCEAGLALKNYFYCLSATMNSPTAERINTRLGSLEINLNRHIQFLKTGHKGKQTLQYVGSNLADVLDEMLDLTKEIDLFMASDAAVDLATLR